MKTCSIEGCEKRAMGRGWCSAHYAKWRKYGDPLTSMKRVGRGVCSVDDCAAPVEARGWCNAHYTRWRFHGDVNTLKVGRYRGAPCAVDGCERRARYRGWCPMHHKRWLTHGDPLVALKRKNYAGEQCNVDGCTQDARSSGMCTAHYGRAYVARNKERTAESQRRGQRRRKMRKANAEGSHTPEEWAACLARFDGKCAYCGEPAVERDHVVPISRGGPDSIDNIVPACRSCNARKRTRTPEEWLSDAGRSR